MRCKLRKLAQAAVLCVCLVFYINFFLLARGFVAVNDRSAPEPGGEEVRGQGPKVPFGKPPQHQSPRGRPVVQFQVGTQPPQVGPESKDIYPSLEHYSDDRILKQLKFIPKPVQRQLDAGSDVKLKTILVYSGLGGWAVKSGQQTFLEQKCPVPYCTITSDRGQIKTADVVMFNSMPGRKPMPHQNFLLYLLESPYHTPGLSHGVNNIFNWTATYRHDSTIVAPYEKFVPYNASIVTQVQTRNFAEGKTKKVAWFVSNCGARNNRRQYAEELKKYIEVDIYGRCGTKQCPRHQSSKCFDMLENDYKFYLAFENSNCRDYITEKFFVNGLKHDVIPIVMGAAPEDYARASPPHSFIHVDEFESPKALADYLHKLDQDDDLYNEYFRWKFTGDIINTFYWCRVCALAHDTERPPSWYEDVNAWWRGKDVCIGSKSWREVPNRPKLIADLAIQGAS